MREGNGGEVAPRIIYKYEIVIELKSKFKKTPQIILVRTDDGQA